MRNMGNEEKILKRYLKNRISLNTETMVKFLITGTIALSLTACGGGGGGGGSSEPAPVPPIVEPEDPNLGDHNDAELPDIGVDMGGVISGEKDVTLDENKSSTDKGTALYKVSDSTVTISEKTTLSVKADGSAAIYAVDKTVGLNSEKERSTVVENKGTIEVHGHATAGMVSDGSTTAVINSGTINASSEKVENGDSIVYGMVAQNNGLAENRGTVVVKNSGIGMLAKENSTVINSGVIDAEGFYYYETDSEGNVVKEISGSTGMRVESGSTAINDGEIKMSGTSTFGMVAREKSSIINNQKISASSQLGFIDESDFDSDGNFIEEKGIGYTTEALMDARVNSYAENNGTLSGEGAIFGMVVRDSSEGINKGDISIVGKVEKVEDGSHVISSSAGIRLKNDSKGINEGSISILGGEAMGMDAKKNSEAINKGSIYLESTKDVIEETRVLGMMASSNSRIENSGLIAGSGKIIGMDISDSSFGENNGDIELESLRYEGRRVVDSNEWEVEVQNELLSNAIGMKVSGKDSIGINNKNIKIAGYGTGIYVDTSATAVNNGKIEGRSEEVNSTYYYSFSEETGSYKQEEGVSYTVMIGMDVKNGTIENSEGGEISILGRGKGMNAIGEGSVAKNSGKIVLESKHDKWNVIDENGEIEELYTWSPIAGMEANNATIQNDGEIILLNDGQGIKAMNQSTAINNGKIVLNSITSNENGDYVDWDYHVIGMELKDSVGENNGDIVITGNAEHKAITIENSDFVNNGSIEVESVGEFAIGISIYENAENKTVVNKGEIKVFSSVGESEEWMAGKATGVSINEGDFLNKGYIKAETEGGYAIGIDSRNGNVSNDGQIDIVGSRLSEYNKSAGIYVQSGTATNNGVINVEGPGAWGMIAGDNGVAINSETGIINVSATAEGGMLASTSSSRVENYGVINIAGDSEENAMQSFGNGTVVNNGEINTNADITIGSSTGGNYVIGTSEDGSYGKISAKNVDIDGDVIVSANITKNGFKDEYTMQNVIDAEDITLGDEFKLVSNSLLYDAEGVSDRWGNLDATLSRNDKVLSDFTTGYITDSAEIFGKYQNEVDFEKLSSDAKEVVKAIDTSSVEGIEKSLSSLTPTMYSNLGRQILETSETFKEQDLVAIESLGEHSYNFTFIGEYRDVESRRGIEGYDSKISGFVGAMNFGDGTYGTIGYGYNDIDYKNSGDGNIQTIHLGLNRFMSYSGVDMRFGIGGEYNFHENKRAIDILSRKAESDFDSYGVRGSAELSKRFGDEAYLKPFLGLDLAYMKYDEFTESGAGTVNTKIESESYTSLLPKVGTLVGTAFDNFEVYAAVQYSYELGDMEKDTMFSYEGFDGKARLTGDDLECGTTSLKAGANYKIDSFVVGAAVGKNFGRRDNSFMSLNLGYRF